MADRNVTVRLKADVSQYQRGLAAAAAQTSAFGKSSDGAGKEIDRLSGRLRLFADAAITLGPAMAPLGAAAVGGLVAMAAQLGATAGALGVTLLAVKGLGDGLDALNAYQLDPTAENLEKLHQEMDKLGPSGEDFVRFLDSIGPELQSLQYAARDGLLPGAQEGIESLMERLPELRSLVSGMAETLGDLSADAGAALAGPRFDAFFSYLKTDGIPILDDTARTLGYLVEALANTMQAFAPLQGDFSGGLLDFAQGLAEASADLKTNAGFQEFVDYIRESGPQVLDTLGALANMFLQIVQAAAPLGGPVLRVLETFANILATIADSDLGTPIFTAIAAMTVYSRAVSIGSSMSERFRSSLDSIASSGRKTESTLSKIGRTAGGIAAVGIAVGAIADGVGRIDTQNLDRSLEALTRGVETETITEVVDSIASLSSTLNSVDLGEIVTVGGLFGDTTLDKQADNIAAVDQALASLVEGGNAEAAAEAYSQILALAEEAGVSTSDVTSQFGQYALALENVAASSDDAAGATDGYTSATDAAAEAAQAAAQQVTDMVDAMREQRSEALRSVNATLNYQESIDEARKSLKENGRTVDETTEKGRANLRALYGLADGWNQQSDAAKNATGSLRTARDGFIKTATDMGMTEGKAKRLADQLFEIPAKRRTEVGLDGVDNAINKAEGLKAILDQIKSKDITIAVHYLMLGNKPDAPVPGDPNSSRTSGRVSGRRSDRSSDPLGRKTDVSPLDIYTSSRGGTDNTRVNGLKGVDVAARGAAEGLKGLQRRLTAAQAAVERETAARDDLIQASRDFAAAVGAAYSKADPFGGGLSDFDLATEANTNDTNTAAAALAEAAAKGLDGVLYQMLAESGNLQLLQEFAGLSAAEIAIREQKFAGQSNAQGALGQGAANQAYAQAIKDQTTELREAQQERKRLAGLVHRVEDRLDRLPERVEDGARRGVGEREKRTAAKVRTG